MFCKYCGHQVADGSLFCPSCGNRLDSPQESQPQNSYTPPQQNTPPYQGAYTPPTGGYQPPQSNQGYNGGYQPYQSAPNYGAMPMNWYKFLIYFALFASCVLNAIYGLGMLTGMVYGDASSLVYAFYGSLKVKPPYFTADLLIRLRTL